MFCMWLYHVYKKIWEFAIGEELDCQREPSNIVDHYAVAVMKRGMVVGHCPKKLSHNYSLFIRRGGVIRLPSHVLENFHGAK